MQEVPEDDWLCSVCRAHQIKGVTDCISEAEKSGLLCRQEPLGYDRHARKYWFLCRRIIVEGENETWYYSSKNQLEELLESLDAQWDTDLISMIYEIKEDIIKQMSFTEDLTVAAKGNRKSVLDIENAQLVKIQVERSLRRKKEEEERAAKEEEERKKREEEEEKRKEEQAQEDKEESADKNEAKNDEDENELEEVTTTHVEETTNSVSKKADKKKLTTAMIETTTTTTTVTTVRSTTTKSSLSSSTPSPTPSANESNDGEDEPPAKKPKVDGSGDCAATNSGGSEGETDSTRDSDTTPALEGGDSSSKEDKTIVLSNKSALAEAIKSSSDGKPKVISLQSLLPSARQTLLDAVDKGKDDSGKGESGGTTKTVLLVNREGGKVTLQVQRQPVVGKDEEESTSVSATSTSVSTSSSESRKMVTRSRTGSLTPKLFTDSVTLTTSSSSMKTSGKSSEETLSVNKDGEVTHTRRKVSVASTLTQQSIYFKLGSEGKYKQYQNQFTTNTLALNKHQHNEERDKRRHLSHKFSLTQNSDFKWNGNILGNRMSTLATLRLTITQLEGGIQTPFLHINWPNHRQNWQKAVQMCQTPRDFALALAVLESCIKPCVMNPVWFESLGHLRLNRITAADREEWKKKEKEQKRRREDEEDVRQLVWIKYTMGLKHQVWKQKGEEYRVTGGNGWQWISATRNFKNERSQDTVGLRFIAHRRRVERVKEARAKRKESPDDDQSQDSLDKDMDSPHSPKEAGEDQKDQSGTKPSGDQNFSKSKEELGSQAAGKDTGSGEAAATSDGVKAMEIQAEEKEPFVEESQSAEASDRGVKEEVMESDEIKTAGGAYGDTEAVGSKDENSTSMLPPPVKDEKPEDTDNSTNIPERKSTVTIKPELKIASSPRKDKAQISYEEYLDFMKRRYVENEEKMFTLELLKSHPSKVDAELINVSDALNKRTYYPKVSKPSSKLDTLLERRMKQDEFERKQRLTIETQIALKEKLTQAIESVQKKKDAMEERERSKALMNGEAVKSMLPDMTPPYACYSLLCRKKDSSGKQSCYSPFCRYRKSSIEPLVASEGAQSLATGLGSGQTSKEGTPDTLSDKDKDSGRSGVVTNGDVNKSKDGVQSDFKEEEENKEKNKELDDKQDNKNEFDKLQDCKGSEEEKGKKEEGESVTQNGKASKMETDVPADVSTEDEEVDIEGEAQKDEIAVSSSSDSRKSSSGPASKIAEVSSERKPNHGATDKSLSSSSSSSSKNASVSDIVRNLVIKTMAEKAVAGGDKGSVLNAQALANAVANMSMEDLKAKLPPRRSTSDKFRLAKFTRIGVKKLPLVAKTGRLPAVHKFEAASSKKRSVLILERHELRKIARLGSRRESVMFNYNCKLNQVHWPYPCPRPVFRTAWRYRTMNLLSLSAAALQLRILWACIKWDDMAAKPPAGGTNTISTETEITTTELLKRREVGSDVLRSEFLVRKIVVPLGVPEKPKEDYTPQRSGLRVRKKVEPSRQTEPSVVEVWVPEESLELWEIKQFGEKLEKQRQALKEKAAAEKAASSTVTTSNSSGTSSISVGTSSSQGLQTTALMKAHMEQQLKQQRLALAQRRIAENQGIKISSSATGGNISTLAGGGGIGSGQAATIIINNATQPGRTGTTYKTLTVSTSGSSSLLAPGVIKTMQPKSVISSPGSLLGSQLRPGIRLQLPGSSLQQLRPGSVTLAPKPGATTVSSATGTSTITRLISPARTAAPATVNTTPQQTGGKTHTIQIRPQTPGQPVQNLHFTQTPGGQLQVRGLLPGQVIQRMPDGKLQIISINTSQQQSQSTASSIVVTTTASAPVSSTPATPPRPTITIRPQQPQQILVTPPAATTAATPSTGPTLTPANRLVIPAGLPATAIRQVLTGSGGLPKQLIINRPGGGTQVISAQSLASMLSGVSQSGSASVSATVVSAPGVGTTSNLSSAIVISAPGPVITSNPTTPTVTVASVASSVTIVNPAAPTSSFLQSSQPASQTIISTLKPGAALISPTSGSSPGAGTSLLAGQVISASSLLQRPAVGTSLLNLGTGAQIPKLLGTPPAGGPILARTLAASSASLSPQPQLVLRPSVATVGGQPAKIISIANAGGTTPSLSSPPSIQLKSVPVLGTSAPQIVLQPSRPSLAATSILPQILTSQPSAGSASAAISSPEPGLASPPAGSVASPGTAVGAPKYAITNAVLEQVVRQALLQNQAPEIQQKLLAMQKQIQQQSQTAGGTATSLSLSGSMAGSSATSILSSSGGAGVSTARRGGTSAGVNASSARPQSQSQASEQARAKSKAMTAEQREEANRNSICSQVMKCMLDRIEREEKQEQRNKKKQESADEKQKRLTIVNQQKALYKHKEALKKEILRKRSLMEKNLQQEIYNEMADKLKRSKPASQTAPAAPTSKSPGAGTPASSGSQSSRLSPGQATAASKGSSAGKAVDTPKASSLTVDSKSNRKRKQKIISTGLKGSLNPKELLYCTCKKPYDDRKFYIGCDLCSNWFHGSCVGISEERAKFIDSYICEDCRKQQENTSEELYCLCRTPYDENQFYIGCDRCQDWFHGRCVGITESEADKLDVYLCPNCQKQEKADPIAQKPLTMSEYQQLAKLLKDMQAHKMAWPFLQPVDPTEVPDYYDIVSEPMDLTIVEAKLNAKAYTRLNDFMKDMTKIFDNCRLYNPVDTPYFQCAEVVETYFAQKVKSLRSSHKL
ncbi:nucleosome-remodeling factor subunit bptf-like [Plakobranchus ocellatus]|uniref:Nucleosome-remodeling factor subunit bptf-like n=1 Tax=Plakobranchus ocellatus TaxID=259542 RepID=A0AAV3ZR17_9GAST|nr:nucleosome-remodeling factor subunit bptf-like [Plakobranchus ocellatus]